MRVKIEQDRIIYIVGQTWSVPEQGLQDCLEESNGGSVQVWELHENFVHIEDWAVEQCHQGEM